MRFHTFPCLDKGSKSWFPILLIQSVWHFQTDLGYLKQVQLYGRAQISFIPEDGASSSRFPQSSSAAHQGVANSEDEKASDRVAYGSGVRYHAGSATRAVQTLDGLFCTDGGVLVGCLCHPCSVALAKVHVRCEEAFLLPPRNACALMAAIVPYRRNIPAHHIVRAWDGDRHATAAIGRGRGKNKGRY